MDTALSMIRQDAVPLVASYAYATGVLVLGEVLRRVLRVPQDLTRKFVHIAAGMWIFGVMHLFHNKFTGLIPFATFIPVNYGLHRLRLLPSIDSPDSSLGTVWFAAVITALFAAFWVPNDPPRDVIAIAAAALMVMTWGDALAAVVGVRFGKRRYRAFRAASVRSYEGSAVMLIASFAAIVGTLLSLPVAGVMLPVNKILRVAAPAAVLATVVEGITPGGLDNLTVPLVAVAALLTSLKRVGCPELSHLVDCGVAQDA
jgi:phytol kinase